MKWYFGSESEKNLRQLYSGRCWPFTRLRHWIPIHQTCLIIVWNCLLNNSQTAFRLAKWSFPASQKTASSHVTQLCILLSLPLWAFAFFPLGIWSPVAEWLVHHLSTVVPGSTPSRDLIYFFWPFYSGVEPSPGKWVPILFSRKGRSTHFMA